MRSFTLLLCCLISVLKADSQNLDLNLEYPWINETYPDCSNLEFQEFNNGAFAYIYVSDGTLFFQDGTVYCRDRQDTGCKTLYQLTDDPSSVWICEGLHEENTEEVDNSPQPITLNISENESQLKVGEMFCSDLYVSDLKKVLSFQFQLELSNQNLQFLGYDTDLQNVTVLQEDNIIKVIWFSEDLIPIDLNEDINMLTLCFIVIDNINSLTTLDLLNTNRLFSQFVTEISNGNFIENINLNLIGGNIEIEESISTNEGENDIDSLGLPITEYTWMTSAAQDFGCEDLTVTEFDFDAYSFFYFFNGENGVLYYQDGTFYCRDGTNVNCKEIYDLSEELVSNTWSCEGDDSDSENNSEIPESLENEYPWISTFFNCDNNSIVTEFESSIFKFIYVEPQGSLYFQDGTFYCQDSESRLCPELYNLTSVTNQWSCNQDLQTNYHNLKSKQISEQEYIIYPNPSSGEYFINHSNGLISFEVFDNTGRLILQDFNSNSKRQEFDLSQFDDGIYFMRIKSDYSEFVTRIMKRK